MLPFDKLRTNNVKGILYRHRTRLRVHSDAVHWCVDAADEAIFVESKAGMIPGHACQDGGLIETSLSLSTRR